MSRNFYKLGVSSKCQMLKDLCNVRSGGFVGASQLQGLSTLSGQIPARA